MADLTRRALLAASGAALPLVSLRAQPALIELKVSHYLPPVHVVQKELDAVSATLEQRSGGRLRLRIYPAGQLGPVPRQFDLARNGQADIAVGLTGATPGRYPMTEFSTLPFIAPARGPASEVTSRRLTELTPHYLSGEFPGLRVLWFCVSPSSGLFTSRREITRIEDVAGLKMRYQGEVQAKTLRVLNAVPLAVPPGEIADAMAKGTLDGAMFAYEGAESFSVGSVVHHVVEPAFSSATIGCVMNPARYDSLAPDLRGLIDELMTGPAVAERIGRAWQAAEAHGRATMVAQNVAINTLAPAELARLKAVLQPVVAEAVEAQEKAGKPARAFLAAYQA